MKLSNASLAYHPTEASRYLKTNATYLLDYRELIEVDGEGSSLDLKIIHTVCRVCYNLSKKR